MTAVEWLMNKLNLFNITKDITAAIEQAKEIEKQQIIESARYYFHERGKLTPEQYYKETYETE